MTISLNFLLLLSAKSLLHCACVICLMSSSLLERLHGTVSVFMATKLVVLNLIVVCVVAVDSLVFDLSDTIHMMLTLLLFNA